MQRLHLEPWTRPLAAPAAITIARDWRIVATVTNRRSCRETLAFAIAQDTRLPPPVGITLL